MRTTNWIGLLSLTIIFAINNLYSQGLKVGFTIKGYQNDTLIVGNYFGEKQIVKDTLFAKSAGKFEWVSNEMPKPGMYLILLKPENSFLQFIVNGNDKDFEVSLVAKDLEEVKFKRSEDNTLFYDYLTFLKDKKVLADTAKARIERAKLTNTKDAESEKILSDLDKVVKEHQKSIVAKFPKSITGLIIKSNIDIDIPEYTGEEKDVQLKKYLFYREHYFDNININDPALIRTPFLHPKIDFYIKKLTSQHPDSLIIAVDRILNLLEPNEEAYRYYLADFLNTYAQMKMVGLDAIYVHLVDNYYSKGKATWVSDDNLGKMKENADDLRPILIGKKLPDFKVYKEDQSPIRLYDIKSPYTVVIFWAPDCGHCKKIMPSVVEFYKKNKNKGVKMLAVCTKGGEKTPTCWPAVKEKGMEDFINTADEYQRFNSVIKVKSTPKIFILDENKEILIKDIPGEEIDRIFNEIVEMDEKRRLENKN